MKTIATVVTSLLLSLGPLVSPAAAEEPTPTECDETVQAWKDRALAAEDRARALDVDLYFSRAAEKTLIARAATLLARAEFAEANLRETRAELADKQRQFYRQYNKITRQHLTIQRLRRELRAGRRR